MILFLKTIDQSAQDKKVKEVRLLLDIRPETVHDRGHAHDGVRLAE
jgi:hypothetical protein